MTGLSTGIGIGNGRSRGTVKAKFRRWNMAGYRKLWSVVGKIYLKAHLGTGLVRVWS